jgi:hypothetical protein
MVPAGPELRNLLQRLIPRSEVVRDGRNVGDVAEAAKAEALGRGAWSSEVGFPTWSGEGCWTFRSRALGPLKSL